MKLCQAHGRVERAHGNLRDRPAKAAVGQHRGDGRRERPPPDILYDYENAQLFAIVYKRIGHLTKIADNGLAADYHRLKFLSEGAAGNGCIYPSG
jgi:hypothetical protein